MTTKQRAYLKSLAMTMTPILQLGKGGLTPQNTAAVEEALAAVSEYPSDMVYCIGGDSIYSQFLEHCDTVFVTRIGFTYEADAFFPDLDKHPDWKLAGSSDEQTYFDLEYEFDRYEKVK